jgi:hypothetical protein
MGFKSFFKGLGKDIVNVGKTVVNTIAPAPVKIGMAVVDKLTGGDPEADRQAEEDRKFNEEINAQTAEIGRQTAAVQAENQQIAGMLGNMRSESDLMFQAAMGRPRVRRPPCTPACSATCGPKAMPCSRI